ncbi:MAG: bifunctional aspartate kinase/homoserine dehydrogenase I [Spirochaetales bacterium]|nr:bifunctional aspartate kinase/homoserine dehydrogenase I [Spirochaetales bacterium]
MKKSYSVYKFDRELYSTAEGIDKILNVVKPYKGGKLVIVASQNNDLEKKLEELVDLAVSGEELLWSRMEKLKSEQLAFVEKLIPSSSRADIETEVRQGFQNLGDVLKSVWLVSDCSDITRAYVIGMGNIWITRILSEKLKLDGFSAGWINSKELIDIKNELTGITVLLDSSALKINALINEKSGIDIFVVTGGRGLSGEGKSISLGRHGMEVTASVYANILTAEELVFWTNSDGVKSADPKKVPAAVTIPRLSYAEATELAFIGAEILHPGAFTYAMHKKIPICIRNINNPDSKGTIISDSTDNSENNLIKGFSIVDNISLLNIEGSGMIGVPGISSRLFSALFKKNISVITISQASSEHSICCAVSSDQADEAKKIAREIFEPELTSFKINSIETEDGCAILGAIGDRMSGTPGISAKFFGALGKAGVNVHAIAQGSSERNISAIIKSEEATKALRAVHSGFYLSNQTLSIGVIGPGLIGSTLLDQIASESERLKENFGVDLRLRGISRSREMVLDENNIDMSKWRNLLDNSSISANIEAFTAHINSEYIPHRVIIDCTTSEGIPANYLDWVKKGIHIITPNKKAGTTPMPQYRELIKETRKRGVHFLYETTVGAGLPIIGTLRDLILTGDKIKKIEGVFSGTLAYLFWRFDGTTPFSTLVREARELGFTEPDPRDDLSGMDIVRKTVILAREAGHSVEIEDIPVRSLVPDALVDVSLDEFMSKLEMMDEELDDLYKEAVSRNEVIKYTGIIEEDGKCEVLLKSYPKDHPFAGISGTDNIVAFTTARYDEQPLVVRGPGAGPHVTAGGVFADLLRLASYLGAKL